MKEKISNVIQEKLTALGLSSVSKSTLIVIAIITGSIWLSALPFEMIILGGMKCNSKTTTKDYLLGVLLITSGLILSSVVIFLALSIKYALNR
jgi:hypothetical protein